MLIGMNANFIILDPTTQLQHKYYFSKYKSKDEKLLLKYFL